MMKIIQGKDYKKSKNVSFYIVSTLLVLLIFAEKTFLSSSPLSTSLNIAGARLHTNSPSGALLKQITRVGIKSNYPMDAGNKLGLIKKRLEKITALRLEIKKICDEILANINAGIGKEKVLVSQKVNTTNDNETTKVSSKDVSAKEKSKDKLALLLQAFEGGQVGIKK